MQSCLARAMRRGWTGCLLALAGLCALSDAQGGAPLVIGFDSASAPTMYAGPNQEAAGIYPAIVRKAFERMGEPVRLVAQPFNRVIAGLRAGTLGSGSLVLTPERAALADFSAPYTLEQVAVYHRRGGAAAYAGLDSLRGHTLGVMRGWSYGQRFDEARGAGQF
ncbi:MAG TPA: transporter substrate-binding domain-containing protein, partial [Telluria sp.]|nr:transporter substrate-binding domain-containing protein [Telluria sp.]